MCCMVSLCTLYLVSCDRVNLFHYQWCGDSFDHWNQWKMWTLYDTYKPNFIMYSMYQLWPCILHYQIVPGLDGYRQVLALTCVTEIISNSCVILRSTHDSSSSVIEISLSSFVTGIKFSDTEFGSSQILDRTFTMLYWNLSILIWIVWIYSK